MTDISRRGFLGGVAASAVVAALPAPAAGAERLIGIYNGVPILEVVNLRAGAMERLRGWYAIYYDGGLREMSTYFDKGAYDGVA